MWTTSTAGSCTISSAESKARSAPSSAAAARADAGEEAATPSSSAPARRAERAWTLPMNPVPAIAAWRAIGMEPKRGLVQLSSKSPSASSNSCFTFTGMTPNSSPASAGSLLRLIRAEVAVTRADLARVTGLARSTVAQRVDALLAKGLVYDTGGVSTGGRPPNVLTFNRDAGVVLVADLG